MQSTDPGGAEKILLAEPMTMKFRLILISLGILVASFAHADDINQQILDLRKQVEQLTKQAQQYRNNVQQKQREGNTLQHQIDILNNQILGLETKITITGKEIDATRIEISDLESKIYDAQQKIDKQKAAIGQLVSILYQQDKLDLVAILLKSSHLSDFTSQIEATTGIASKLVALLADLKTAKANLEDQQAELTNKKSSLEVLNKSEIEQKASLGESKDNKNSLLVKTRGQEQEYQRLLSEAERKQQEFFSQLQELEKQAVQSGSFIVHVTANTIPPKGSKIFRYPIEDFVMTQGYGFTSYARRGVYGGLPHNGIDLSGPYGTPIHPIGSGTLLASGFNNGFGNWVAVRHDNNMVSIYGHMRAPSGIANGTAVTTDSVIGYEGSTGSSTGAHVHLSLYRDFFTYLKNNQLYFNYFDGSVNPLDYVQ